MLHYVALCDAPCTAQDLRHVALNQSQYAGLADTLSQRWFGLLPGFHRFLLNGGQVVLTLCVGERLSLLRAQQFQADAVELALPRCNAAELTWCLKALARCCRRGTTFTTLPMDANDQSTLQVALRQSGFRVETVVVPTNQPDRRSLAGQFDPPWVLQNTRQNVATTALSVGRCAVIGAGLAGASVAAALARRGWQVQVLDQADAPAAGASGLPVGLVVPHVSSDDCALSKLSRAGVRLMLQQAGDLLELNRDWAPSGVLERQIGGTPQCPATWPPAGQAWFDSFDKPDGSDALGEGIWHHQGAWIKPAALVKAWLKQPGIGLRTHAKVVNLCQLKDGWSLLDDVGQVLCHADCVVFANAAGAFDLLHKIKHTTHYLQGLEPHLPKTQGMRGMLNWGWHDAFANAASPAFSAFPVNGSGSMMPYIPMQNEQGGAAWFMGSSYQPDTQPERGDLANQALNFEHLQLLLPQLAAQLAPQFASHELHCWKGTRCVTQDRMPAVGPLTHAAQPSLWLCAGMGSRGLSFSVLCAELLAARLCGEPWPVEARLARLLDALRT